MKAAVLCGGEGTRLRPLTHYFQKTMIPIGRERRPLLEYIVRLMVYHNVRDIALLSGYRSEEIENYFGDGKRFGAKIKYSKDPPNLKGSANALMNAISTGKIADFEQILVYYGDVLSALDFGKLVRSHKKSGADLTLVLSKKYSVPVGVATVADGEVTAFREKPNLDLNVTMGCLLLSKSCIPLLRSIVAEGRSRDLMSHFVPLAIEKGMKVRPFFLDGFWLDIGTIEAYEKMDVKAVEKSLAFLGWPAPGGSTPTASPSHPGGRWPERATAPASPSRE